MATYRLHYTYYKVIKVAVSVKDFVGCGPFYLTQLNSVLYDVCYFCMCGTVGEK